MLRKLKQMTFAQDQALSPRYAGSVSHFSGILGFRCAVHYHDIVDTFLS
jgi:hypothetical protein